MLALAFPWQPAICHSGSGGARVTCSSTHGRRTGQGIPGFIDLQRYHGNGNEGETLLVIERDSL